MCGLEIESTQHFLFCCHFYHHVERSELLNRLYEIDLVINELNEDSIINLVFIYIFLQIKFLLTVFPLSWCGRKNDLFCACALRIRGNKLRSPYHYRAALIIRGNIYITHTKLERKKSSHIFFQLLFSLV